MQGSNKAEGHTVLPTILQDHERDRHILNHNEDSLAERAEGETTANIVCEANDVGDGLEQVGEEAQALCGLGVVQLKDLGDLDDRGGGNDADTETL